MPIVSLDRNSHRSWLVHWIWGQAGRAWTDNISSCAEISETDNHACFR